MQILETILNVISPMPSKAKLNIISLIHKRIAIIAIYALLY